MPCGVPIFLWVLFTSPLRAPKSMLGECPLGDDHRGHFIGSHGPERSRRDISESTSDEECPPKAICIFGSVFSFKENSHILSPTF